ncbi:hypothetical protein [Nocardioides sp. MH1]|uniref:hypothetical protein n=1 Tax=Nocardioides sp. MH1 TaxID=3242490 RepID=UPI003521C703
MCRRGLGARRDERGAVAVFVACTLGLVVAITGFVVDLGMERVTGSDLQALADGVALDLAREIHGGRTQAQLEGEGTLSNSGSALRHSVDRYPDILGSGLAVAVDWGSYDAGVWNTTTDPPTAVKVVASAHTDFAVMPGQGDVSRSAYAVSSNSACYRLGTFVAAVTTGDSTVLAPLNHLFGANLTLVGYQALANAHVTIAELAASSKIGSPQKLLTGSVSYSDLVLATIEALSRQQSSPTAAISALQGMVSAAGSVGAVKVGDVLHVSPSDSAALGIALDVLDLIGSARLSTGENFIEVTNLQAGVPAVGFQFTGGIKLISAAQLACGVPNTAGSVAKNAQLQGDLGITFTNMPSLNVPNVATLQTAKGTGTLSVSLADGEGRLISPPEAHCGSRTAADPDTFAVGVHTQVATYGLRTDLDISGDIKVDVLQGLGLGNLLTNLLGLLLLPNKVTFEAHVRLDIATGKAEGSTVANLAVPPNDVTPVETGSSVFLDASNVVPTVTEVKINGKTAVLSSVLPLTSLIVNELTTSSNQFVQKTLVPLVGNINNTLIGPVARMVGLRFGGADVYAVGAVCGEPNLWG